MSDSESSLALFRRVDLFSSLRHFYPTEPGQGIQLQHPPLSLSLDLSLVLPRPLLSPSLPRPSLAPRDTGYTPDHLRRPWPIPTTLVRLPFLPEDHHQRLLFLFYHLLSPVLTCLLRLLLSLLFIYVLHNSFFSSPDSIPPPTTPPLSTQALPPPRLLFRSCYIPISLRKQFVTRCGLLG